MKFAAATPRARKEKRNETNKAKAQVFNVQGLSNLRMAINVLSPSKIFHKSKSHSPMPRTTKETTTGMNVHQLFGLIDIAICVAAMVGLVVLYRELNKPTK